MFGSETLNQADVILPGRDCKNQQWSSFKKSEQQVKLTIASVYLGNWAWHHGVSDKLVCVFYSIKYRYDTHSCHCPSENVCFSLNMENHVNVGRSQGGQPYKKTTQ